MDNPFPAPPPLIGLSINFFDVFLSGWETDDYIVRLQRYEIERGSGKMVFWKMVAFVKNGNFSGEMVVCLCKNGNLNLVKKFFGNW